MFTSAKFQRLYRPYFAHNVLPNICIVFSLPDRERENHLQTCCIFACAISKPRRKNRNGLRISHYKTQFPKKNRLNIGNVALFRGHVLPYIPDLESKL